MIKVLVVEDSLAARQLLVHVLSSDPEIQVVGAASDGKQAVELAQRETLDVITMDVNMPQMDGFEATRIIMETSPVAILIVSASWSPDEVENTFRAMEAGAVAISEKPRGFTHPDFERDAKELIEKIKLISEVKVVRRWPRVREEKLKAQQPERMKTPRLPPDLQLIAIGASTGGPIALQTVLGALPKDLNVPVLIVQHIASGFTQGLVDWLNRSSILPVHLATDAERPLPGHVYIAPDGLHMVVGSGQRIYLTTDEPVDSLRPSVTVLFQSVAKYFGSRAVGVLLTGMGRDGAAGLKLMQEQGAITIAQDKESSIIHGMPGEAIAMDAATHILPLQEIAAALESMVKKR